jgi:metal-responsive CopG/Arc/MetJ family transcriptional regulator
MKKKDEENKQRVQIRLDHDLVERLDRLAEKADMNRSRLIENMILECTNSLELTKKVGLLQTAVVLRNMGETLSAWGKKLGKKKVDIFD